MFAPNVKIFKGKKIRKTLNQVKGNYCSVPPSILIRHQKVTLAADIIFIEKHPFLITQSRAIKIGAVDNLHNAKCETAMKLLQSVISIYKKRGFMIEHVLIDGQFEPWRQE